MGFGSPLYTVFFPYMHHPLVRQMLPTEPVVIELETAYECTQEGSYSDPDSCDSYYVCNTTPEGGLKAHIVNCPLDCSSIPKRTSATGPQEPVNYQEKLHLVTVCKEKQGDFVRRGLQRFLK